MAKIAGPGYDHNAVVLWFQTLISVHYCVLPGKGFAEQDIGLASGSDLM